MNRDATDAICVLSIECLKLFGSQVVRLVLVASNEDYQVVFQKVHVVAFVGLLAHHTMETNVAS